MKPLHCNLGLAHSCWKTIAKHVMNIHMNRQTEQEVEGEIDIEKMKRYIAYSKS